MDMNLNKFQDIVKDRGACHAAVHGWQRIGHDLLTEQWQQQYYPIKVYVFPDILLTF